MNNETKTATATHTGSIVVKSPAFSALSKEHKCKLCDRVGANMQKNEEWYHAACYKKNSDVLTARPVSKAGEAALERSKLVRTVVDKARAEVAETPVSKAPAKVSEARAEVSEARAEVSKAPAKVSEAPAKVSKARAEVSESAKIVVVLDGEKDTPGCPILAITIQQDKEIDQLEVITKNFKGYLESLPEDQRNACIEAASAHVGKLQDQCNTWGEQLPTPEQHKAKEENIRAQLKTNLTHQGELAKQIRLREEKKAEWRKAMRIAADNEDASKDDELANIVDRFKAEFDEFPKDLDQKRQDAIALGNDLNEQLQKHNKYDMVEMKKNLDAWTTFVDGLRTMVIGVENDGSSWDGGSHDTGMCYDYNVNQRFTADQIKNFRDCLRYHLEHTLTDERIEEVVQKNYHDVPAYLLYSIKSLYDPAMNFGQKNRALFFKGVIDNGQPYEGFNPWTVCADEEVLAGAARTVKERGERSEDEETERSEDDEGEEHESEDDEAKSSEGEDDEAKSSEGEDDEKESSTYTASDIFGDESYLEPKPAPAPTKRMSPAVRAAQIAKAQKQEAEALKAAQAAEKAQAVKAAEADKAAKAKAAEAAKAAKAAEAEAAKAAKAAKAEADKAAKAKAAQAKAAEAEAAKAAEAEAAKAKAAEAEAAKAAQAKAEADKAAQAKAKAAQASNFRPAKFDDEGSNSNAKEIAKPLKRARESTDAQEEGKKLFAQAAATLRNLDSKDIQAARNTAGRMNPVRACSTPTSNVHFTLSGKCGAWESVTSSSQGRSSGDKIERVMEEILCKSKKGQQSCCGGMFIPNKNTTVVIICNSIRLSQNTGNYEANVQAIETYTKEGTDPVYFVAYVYNGKACYNMVYPPEEASAPKRARKSK